MGPLLLVVAGLVALVAGALVLRSFGPAYRVGRLLAVTPSATIEEAEAFAAAGRSAYVRINGRLDSAEDFPDEHDRPLVFRRRRLDVLRDGQWSTVEDDRQLVPFQVRSGLAALAVDADELDSGLIVLPRETVGTAGDIPERVPPDLSPTTPVRLRIEQVSAVEHAEVLGVPRRRTDGTTVLTAGLGRPLILSTVDRTEAMQLLADGRRARPLAALTLLAAGLILLAVGFGWAVAAGLAGALAPPVAAAASPVATPAQAGDTRSAGEGPGLVGAPLAAIALVALIAAASVIVTLAYVRLSERR